MKKSLLIIAAVAMSFVACSKEEIQTVSKGMTLSANVADDNTKATITDNGDKTWSFKWEIGDVVSVKSPSGELYSFRYDGTSFKCETAVPESGTWSVVYPANFKTDGIELIKQDGTIRSAMSNYYMTGECPSTGSSTLSCKMEPKLAVLALTPSTKGTKCTIMASSGAGFFKKLTKEGNWELAAKEQYFPATTSDHETQYFVVPAGVSLQVWTNKSTFSSTKTLTKGKVYTLSIM